MTFSNDKSRKTGSCVDTVENPSQQKEEHSDMPLFAFP